MPRALDARKLVQTLPLPRAEGSSVAFFGLDRGRAVLPVLKAKLPPSARLFDVMVEEWPLSRDELPAEARTLGAEVLRIEKGNLVLPSEAQCGLVLFVDAYQRLWNPAPILKRLKEHMLSTGLLAVVDRKGPDGEARRLAGHRRRISPKQVTEDLRMAGFQLRRKLPAPAKDRFFLLFSPE